MPRSLEIGRRAGFERLNLDLIYAIPGQIGGELVAVAGAGDGAADASTFRVTALTYEPNTPMAVRKRLGQFEAAEESLELAMMHDTRGGWRGGGWAGVRDQQLCARRAQECRHNLIYWTGGNYLGLGPSAASHVEGRAGGTARTWASGSRRSMPARFRRPMLSALTPRQRGRRTGDAAAAAGARG